MFLNTVTFIGMLLLGFWLRYLTPKTASTAHVREALTATFLAASGQGQR